MAEGHGTEAAKHCPACGSILFRGYEPNLTDPGDVQPYEICTRCSYYQPLG